MKTGAKLKLIWGGGHKKENLPLVEDEYFV